ncbi:MAG: biosynthetic-type acetolactate synthase large subunit [Bacteroidaceae bacterium]|nr:biosynthetic-type acetolactate synthase large subunit [Bacteroidaceae bacterium]MBR4778668.1 biosynthetic-type acetolactate synthase large subunit [Bacteroidaceae bacterium]
MGNRITGAEALMQALIHEGVTTIFGYPGGGIMPVFDALYDHQDDFRQILVRHEQGAAHAAQGYARSSGKVGVCLVTSGPGATNTITGISDAMLDSTPIVVISGQVGAAALGTDAFQEVDFVCITQPICKWSYQIRSAEDIAWAVARAFYIASSGRPGPVVLDFAKNAQTSMVDFETAQLPIQRGFIPVPQPSDGAIRRAAALIDGAQRPLLLAGQGIELAGAQEELLQFVEKTGIPVGCTLLGLSTIPYDHPLRQGMLGMHGNLAPNVKTNECDVLIAVGMRFDDRVTGKLTSYARQAKVIHLDIDPSEIGKNVPVNVAVKGDCKETLARLTEAVHPAEHKEWVESFAIYHAMEEEQVIRPAIHPVEGPLKMGEVARRVSEATGDKAILVTDVGQNQMMSARYFRFTQRRSIITSGGLGTMGFGLPAAIGATFGAPERTVCLFVGDGGIQMNIQELGTIMESGAPVKIILLNNNYLGNVRQWQELFFHHRYSCTPMKNPDYEMIASAYGIPSRSVACRADLDDAIHEMLTTPGAFLLQAAIEEEENVMPMTPPGADVDQMLPFTDPSTPAEQWKRNFIH